MGALSKRSIPSPNGIFLQKDGDITTIQTRAHPKIAIDRKVYRQRQIYACMVDIDF